MNKIASMLSLCILLAACGSEHNDKPAAVADSSKVDLDKARTEINAANAAFGKAMITGDSATIAALYTSDAKAYPPGGPATDGKGMGADSRMMAGMQLANFDVKTQELTQAGDMLIETNSWSIGVTSGEIDKGRALVIWKMEDGKWKMWRDIWNSEKGPK